MEEKYALERKALDPNDLLTPAEVAPILRCRVDHVWFLCRLPKTDERHFEHMRKGREILVRRQDLTDYIARQIARGK